MDKNKIAPTTAVELRRQAEKVLETKGYNPSRGEGTTQRLLHELEVHQIELEMQNEDLRRSQRELELSRNKYADLYDFAPVGYFEVPTGKGRRPYF